MNWLTILKDFEYYLRIEKGMSNNSVVSYLFDIQKLIDYVSEFNIEENPENISAETLRGFIYEESKNLNSRSISLSILSLIFSFTISFTLSHPCSFIKALSTYTS